MEIQGREPEFTDLEHVDDQMNQSDLTENMWRENACEQVTIAFSFDSHWLTKWCKISSECRAGQNQSKNKACFLFCHQVRGSTK